MSSLHTCPPNIHDFKMFNQFHLFHLVQRNYLACKKFYVASYVTGSTSDALKFLTSSDQEPRKQYSFYNDKKQRNEVNFKLCPADT